MIYKIFNFLIFFCLSLFIFISGAKTQDSKGLFEQLIILAERGHEINFDDEAKNYGFKNFSSAVKAYKKEFDVRITVEEAKSLFNDFLPEEKIKYTKENADKLFNVIINSKYKSAKRYKKKYLPLEAPYKAFAISLNVEREFSRITKDPNIKSIAKHTWTWGRGVTRDTAANLADYYCTQDIKKYRIPFQECMVIDINGVNVLYEFIPKIREAALKKRKDELLLAHKEKKEKEEAKKKKVEKVKKKKVEEVKESANNDKNNKINFIKKIIKSDFKDNDFIIMANLNSTAPHALFSLSGEITFDKNSANYCYFNSSNLNKLQDVYFKKLLMDKYDIQYFYFQNNCDLTSILKNDIIITASKNIISLESTDFSKFTNLFAKKDLLLINFKRLQDIEIFFELRKEKSKELQNNILKSEIEGFGSIVLANNSQNLCLVIPENEKKHLFLINKLNDEYALTGVDKEYNSLKFGSAEEIFINIQRNNCGFLYTSEANLKILINAMDKASIEYELVGKWFYPKDVDEAELLEQDELIKKQKIKLDQQKKDAEDLEKKKNSGELLKEYTANLRKKHENETNGFKNNIQKEFENFYLDKKFEGNFFTTMFQDIYLYYNDLFLKGWESSEFKLETIDYGTGIYKGREVAAHVVNIYTKMKNNQLGEYKDTCIQIGILEDSEFNYFRNPDLFECDDNKDLRKWFLKNQFKTLWNPALKDIEN